MVLYRKYRPQSLDDIIGQVAVKQVLKSAAESKKLAHAYLFCGPRGTGKTSTARVLAKMVNCDNEKLSPCNKCGQCISITQGTNLDVLEMDAASNRGIEDIRALRDNIKLAPIQNILTSSTKKKVYIIDEVHMLSNEAFNALLKTLEEPPSHVLFILATTDVQKVPVTILSRVQKLEFKLATIEELVEALVGVANSEKIEIDQAALLLIAKKAQGSFRDGVKLLDQLSSFGKITQSVVEQNLGMANFDGVLTVLRAIFDGDSAASLVNTAKQLERGATPKELNINILENLRMVFLVDCGLGEQLVKGELGAEKYQLIVTLTSEIKKAYKQPVSGLITNIMKYFQTSLEQSRYVTIPQLPLEIAVVESSIEAQKTPEAAQKPKPDKPAALAGEVDDIQKIQDKWNYVLETVKQYNFSLEALLRSAKVISCHAKKVVIEVPYSFHQRILEAPKSREPLESIFSDILERPVVIATVLGQRVARSEELSNIEVAADDEIVRIASEIFNSESAS